MAQQSAPATTPGQTLLCYLLLCAVVKQLEAQLNPAPVIVDTLWGRIYGQTRKTRTGVDYYSFEGVPYALPPIGFLRFAKPVPLIGRTSTPYKAYKVKPSCYGVGVIGPASEDCLYLDIYVPGTPYRGRRSVMVFFHGGGFVAASPQPSMDALMSQGEAIVVFVHYRLGPFGFLSAAESFLKGNYGLWDQSMALCWVRTNIAGLGGDPARVTIFGSSAGAASVSYHVLAPPSKGHNAVALGYYIGFRRKRSVVRALAISLPTGLPPVFGDFFDSSLVPRLLSQRFGRPGSAAAISAVSKFYSANIPRQFLSALGVAHSYGDPAFVIPAIDFARPLGDLQSLFIGRGNTYFYYFDYCPKFTLQLCMMHGLDNLYLFPPVRLYDPTDARVSRMFIALLTSFSRTGVPRTAGVTQPWYTYSRNTGYSVLRLNGSPQMKPRAMKKKAAALCDC
ncbi:hypothetical protein EGW08_015426 [Elysia chlorotica]|uniref:Carboxylesterase type B domain-containing protein n=1 Tax=Elysia chlorotica TaxID=188477 RepID=A0A433T5I0_ELYCH|nr:hypothetical protein EGW08_015426 [Elysia chlorotica]